MPDIRNSRGLKEMIFFWGAMERGAMERGALKEERQGGK